MFTFYADGDWQFCKFNFAILLKLQKSDACEMYEFYSNADVCTPSKLVTGHRWSPQHGFRMRENIQASSSY